MENIENANLYFKLTAYNFSSVKIKNQKEKIGGDMTNSTAPPLSTSLNLLFIMIMYNHVQ